MADTDRKWSKVGRVETRGEVVAERKGGSFPTVGRTRWHAFWLAALAGTACSDPPAKPAPPDEPVIDSRPGVVQSGGANDAWLGEREACMRYRDALLERAGALQCSVVIPACPELIRPAASLACVAYSSPSVEACELFFSKATTCADVLPGSCVLTAVIDEYQPDCEADPDAGAAQWMHDAGVPEPMSDASTQPTVAAVESRSDASFAPDSGAPNSAPVSESIDTTSTANPATDVATGEPDAASDPATGHDAGPDVGSTQTATTDSPGARDAGAAAADDAAATGVSDAGLADAGTL